MRRVDAMFSRHGPAFRRLSVSWAANVAGDTLVSVALAGTLFFSVPSTEARANVALYLALTLAPFTVIAPVLGGLFARLRGVYRAVLTVSSALRTVLAVVMMMGLTTLWLYPLAFGMLVLSRLYGISKSSMLPIALPQPVALVGANALLARIGNPRRCGCASGRGPRCWCRSRPRLGACRGVLCALDDQQRPSARSARCRADLELGVEDVLAPMPIAPRACAATRPPRHRRRTAHQRLSPVAPRLCVSRRRFGRL